MSLKNLIFALTLTLGAFASDDKHVVKSEEHPVVQSLERGGLHTDLIKLIFSYLKVERLKSIGHYEDTEKNWWRHEAIVSSNGKYILSDSQTFLPDPDDEWEEPKTDAHFVNIDNNKILSEKCRFGGGGIYPFKALSGCGAKMLTEGLSVKDRDYVHVYLEASLTSVENRKQVKKIGEEQVKIENTLIGYSPENSILIIDPKEYLGEERCFYRPTEFLLDNQNKIIVMFKCNEIGFYDFKTKERLDSIVIKDMPNWASTDLEFLKESISLSEDNKYLICGLREDKVKKVLLFDLDKRIFFEIYVGKLTRDLIKGFFYKNQIYLIAQAKCKEKGFHELCLYKYLMPKLGIDLEKELQEYVLLDQAELIRQYCGWLYFKNDYALDSSDLENQNNNGNNNGNKDASK